MLPISSRIFLPRISVLLSLGYFLWSLLLYYYFWYGQQYEGVEYNNVGSLFESQSIWVIDYGP